MTQYEKVQDEFGSFIKRTTDDGVISFIPIDEANADYQTYLSTPIDTLASELSNPSTPQAGE